ncbi:CoA-binding protein [Terriglobus aquaticus]|uniref:CoA-binding protein n=1 Tax=Terriglobus aquaticus TaxID=940139 RepID=A0ABW9KKT7_9BACT|nr:CoA-binding protein [Terriglobus aquaticus]
MNEPDTIRRMLAARTIAVIGLSDDPAKPSHYVSRYMQSAGCRILPVNPSLDHVLGERAYPSLTALPETPELVNVFRLPRYIPAIVDEMIALGLTQLWVQQGILHREAAQHAEAHGISVVMDRCIMVEHRMQRF